MKNGREHQNEDNLKWNAMRKGNKVAFSDLYNSYSRLLLSYGRKVIDDRQLVADCVQELFTYLWTRRHFLGDAPSVKFYLIKSLRSIIIKELNKNKSLVLDYEDNQIREHTSREHQIINEELELERKELIQGAMEKLTDREREILYLKYFVKSTNEEIADLLNIKYQSVKNVIFRALKKLKKHLSVHVSLKLIFYYYFASIV
ncbi:MAG: sigma-70 family RNA polymerase sigma factor [Cytophagales bacterium]|nr:sigma-70 family RNA polymerase sigma factor [Cytophagales bacterium]